MKCANTCNHINHIQDIERTPITLVLGNGIPWSSQKYDKKRFKKEHANIPNQNKPLIDICFFTQDRSHFIFSHPQKNIEFFQIPANNQPTYTLENERLEPTAITHFEKKIINPKPPCGCVPAVNLPAPSGWRPSSRSRSTRTFRCWTP